MQTITGAPAAATMKRRLLAALLALPLVVAAACGGSDGDDSASEREGQTLRIYGFGPGDEVANTRAALATDAVAPAAVRNPRGAFSAQSFLTRLASGNPPDLVYLDRQQVATFAAQGVLEPLTSCIEEQEIDLSQYRTAALDEVTYEEELYALPEFTNQRAIIVNDAAVEQGGLAPTDVDTSHWGRLHSVAERLARVSGGTVTRIGFDPKIPEFFVLWAKANGVDLLSADGRQANLDDPRTVEALAFTKSLIDAQGGWAAFKAFRDTWDFFGARNQVARNQIGAWPMESWYWNVLAENSPDVRVTAVPFEDRRGNTITFFSGNGWAIPRGAEHTELACTWMKTMTTVDAWLAAARARADAARVNDQPFTGLYTANAVADERILEDVYEPVSPQFDQAVRLLVDIQDDAFALPPSPAGAQFQQSLTDAINRALVGRQTPRQALAQAQREFDAAIAEAG